MKSRPVGYCQEMLRLIVIETNKRVSQFEALHCTGCSYVARESIRFGVLIDFSKILPKELRNNWRRLHHLPMLRRK